MNKAMESHCVMKLEHLVFDRIDFQRKGFQTENKVQFQFGFNFEKRGSQNFVVHIDVNGTKENEYTFQVSASGYFSLSSENNLELMMHQNAVAIVFPYIRSQISLLTAQPEMKPVVLPPMNIAQMVEESMRDAANASYSDN